MLAMVGVAKPDSAASRKGPGPVGIGSSSTDEILVPSSTSQDLRRISPVRLSSARTFRGAQDLLAKVRS